MNVSKKNDVLVQCMAVFARPSVRCSMSLQISREDQAATERNTGCPVSMCVTVTSMGSSSCFTASSVRQSKSYQMFNLVYTWQRKKSSTSYSQTVLSFLVLVSDMWISVTSRDRPPGRPAIHLDWGNFNVGHYAQTFQLNFVTFVGTSSFY